MPFYIATTGIVKTEVLALESIAFPRSGHRPAESDLAQPAAALACPGGQPEPVGVTVYGKGTYLVYTVKNFLAIPDHGVPLQVANYPITRDLCILNCYRPGPWRQPECQHGATGSLTRSHAAARAALATQSKLRLVLHPILHRSNTGTRNREQLT